MLNKSDASLSMSLYLCMIEFFSFVNMRLSLVEHKPHLDLFS